METNSFAILSYIRKGKFDKLGNAPIYIRITVNSKRAEFSVKRKVQPKNWCSIRGRVKGSSSKAKSLNHFIDELEAKAFNIHAKLMTKKKPFDAELIKRKLLNIEEAHKTLLQIYDEHNDQIKELIGIDYSYGAYRRHIRTRNHLNNFIIQEYKSEDYFVKEIGLKFINRFHLLSENKTTKKSVTTSTQLSVTKNT